MTDIMKNFKTLAAGTVLGGSVLFTAGLGLANAQPAEPTQAPDDSVTVAVGGVPILESVSTDTAATAAGAICGAEAPEVTAMAESVDIAGTPQTVCSGLPGGELAIQNAGLSTQAPEGTGPIVTPGAAEAVPGQPQDSQSVEPADVAPVETVPGQTG
ncbi:MULTISPECIES: hypothetical protein [Mycobacteriaceae]|uniref:hypothetical protein n=1 Tax=Mycobacteriaceae TaxID=1762 RepID=UPI0008015FCB|nr:MULTISPECIES: hypothetical protein [Mycobacteriaceae]MCK0173622.1 hypothetical protein [Mycolicibacterium sp. F2034L]OBB57288.1 hypothetical protein A5757_22095 [Mycobacterium sp. 852013-51886_SCH5428379]